jgi:hypothetical protein
VVKVVRGVAAECLVVLLLWQMAPHVLDLLYDWLGQGTGTAGALTRLSVVNPSMHIVLCGSA